MDIKHKSVQDLTPIEYQACYRANFGDGGYMRGALSVCRNAGEVGHTILIWDGPEHFTRSLKAWALLTPVVLNGALGVTSHVKRVSKYTTQFWVKPMYRKMGYGKILMLESKKMDPRPHVIPHDKASAELFSAFDVTIMKLDRDVMSLARRKPKVA